MTIRHILVPTDFGPASERVESLAVELAAKLDAKITLLHVWAIPNADYAGLVSWPTVSIEAAARESLGQALERLKAKHPNAKSILAPGVAWERIIAVAKECGADMVVMGTHGRRGVPRWFLGSVAEKVVRLSPVPVLTVGAEKNA